MAQATHRGPPTKGHAAVKRQGGVLLGIDRAGGRAAPVRGHALQRSVDESLGLLSRTPGISRSWGQGPLPARVFVMPPRLRYRHRLQVGVAVLAGAAGSGALYRFRPVPGFPYWATLRACANRPGYCVPSVIGVTLPITSGRCDESRSGRRRVGILLCEWLSNTAPFADRGGPTPCRPFFGEFAVRRPRCRTCGVELVWPRSLATGFCLKCRLIWEQEQEERRK
jgi:hypothetical protein